MFVGSEVHVYEKSTGASIIKYETEKLKKLKIYKNVEDSTMLIPSDDQICAEFMDRNKVIPWD